MSCVFCPMNENNWVPLEQKLQTRFPGWSLLAFARQQMTEDIHQAPPWGLQSKGLAWWLCATSQCSLTQLEGEAALQVSCARSKQTMMTSLSVEFCIPKSDAQADMLGCQWPRACTCSLRCSWCNAQATEVQLIRVVQHLQEDTATQVPSWARPGCIHNYLCMLLPC